MSISTQPSFTFERLYKYWEVFDTIPDGWRIDTNAGSPLHGHVFVTNGFNILTGKQKRALAKIPIVKKELYSSETNQSFAVESIEQKPSVKIDENYRKVMNDLARKKTQEMLLRDIATDITICKLEGWDYSQYLSELVSLLTSLQPTQDKGDK